MDKKAFGQLVATLRKEIRNEFDETMTQYDLAELAKIPLITLQKIEQGRQANIKPDMLLNLAEALQLASRARQVFFLGSLGIKDSMLIKQPVSAQEALDELTRTLAQMQTPAFIADGFGDIVATNRSIPAVYNIEVGQFLAPHLLSQYNINRLLFSPEFEEQRQMMGETLHDFSRRTILQFKVMTLKYRNHWYFQRLLPELNRYPIFREQWQSPTFHNEDIFIQYTPVSLLHPKLGQMKFLSSAIPAVTASGDLHLYSFQPLDEHTAQICTQVTQQVGTEAVRVAPWPKPDSPKGLNL